MTNEQQRIAIAEACGIENTNHVCWRGHLNGIEVRVPDYLNDLNAMHEAEKVLNQMQARTHADHLAESAQDGTWASCHIWHQSAAQRAEAFLRAIGK
jgi:hypothetical protein